MTFNQLRITALFVRAKGIEPIRLSAPDPKSGLSTNFNTPADQTCKCTIKYLIYKLCLSETYADAYAETHCKVINFPVEPVP